MFVVFFIIITNMTISISCEKIYGKIHDMNILQHIALMLLSLYKSGQMPCWNSS